jgi:hypothetical protein
MKDLNQRKHGFRGDMAHHLQVADQRELKHEEDEKPQE